MNRLMRIGAAAASLAAGGMLLVPASFAATDCTISGNGVASTNTCRVKVVRKSARIQINAAKVKTNVGVVSNTGLNSASGNTGSGGVSVTSGSSNVNVNITNNVNVNTPSL